MSLSIVLGGAGCTSLNAAQTANTMGKGGAQFSLEPAYADWGGVTYPRMDFGFRYGLSDSVDIGGKLGSSFAELNAKFQLTDPAKRDFVCSLAPSVGGIELGSSGNAAGIINFSLPVLFGLGVGDGHQIVLGPRLQDFLVNATASSNGSSSTGVANVLGVGASVGFVAKVTDGFRVMPEVGVVVPVLGTSSSSNGDTVSGALTGSGVVLWQVGLTMLLGQNHQPAPAPVEDAPPPPVGPASYP